MSKNTQIHGIGAAENIDSSGEKIDIKNLDCSSLANLDGTFTFEHSAADPSKVLGKILAYKKIFTLKDCETPAHVYFWEKCKVPFLYVMGQLFDGDGHLQAKEVASIFRYDARQRQEGTEVPSTMWFSVEGSILNKTPEDGIKQITDAICRLVTITSKPCNRLCAAELFIPQKQAEQDPMAAFEKSEIIYNSQTVNSEPFPYIALTKSMKPILEYLPAENYFDFTPSDHSDAADAHFVLASQAKGIDFAYHMAKSEEHMKKAADIINMDSKRQPQNSYQTKPSYSRPHKSYHMGKKGATKVAVEFQNPDKTYDLHHLSHDPKTDDVSNALIQENTKEPHIPVDSFEKHPNIMHEYGENNFMDSIHPLSVVRTMFDLANHKSNPQNVIPMKSLGKALAAGMGNAAPASLVNGTALQKEHLRNKIEKAASQVKNLQKMGEYISKKYKLDKHEGIVLAKMLVFRKIKN